MEFQIEIIEGHDTSSYFWFRPVILKEKGKILYDEVAALLESDYNNPRLDDIKKNFSIFYMCAQNDIDYINHDNTAIQKHVSVVIDFYRRFTKRIAAMMENNKNSTVISIMGP